MEIFPIGLDLTTPKDSSFLHGNTQTTYIKIGEEDCIVENKVNLPDYFFDHD